MGCCGLPSTETLYATLDATPFAAQAQRLVQDLQLAPLHVNVNQQGLLGGKTDERLKVHVQKMGTGTICTAAGKYAEKWYGSNKASAARLLVGNPDGTTYMDTLHAQLRAV